MYDGDVNFSVRLSRHFRCASHTLHLIATTDMINIIQQYPLIKKSHDRTIQKCKELWKSLKSPKKREALTEYLGVNLRRPIITRWNSTYDALHQIYSLREKLMNFETHVIVQSSSILINDDFEYIMQYLTIMKPLACTIDKLQGEYYSHYLLPSLVNLRRRWLSLEECTQILYQPLLRDLIKSLEYRFCDFFNVTNNGEFAAICFANSS